MNRHRFPHAGPLEPLFTRFGARSLCCGLGETNRVEIQPAGIIKFGAARPGTIKSEINFLPLHRETATLGQKLPTSVSHPSPPAPVNVTHNRLA